MAIYSFSICLSRVDKAKLSKDKNGNIWLNGTLVETDGLLQFQDSQSSTERELGVERTVIGRGTRITKGLKSIKPPKGKPIGLSV